MKRALLLSLALALVCGPVPNAFGQEWALGFKVGVSEGTGDFADSFQADSVWGLYFEREVGRNLAFQARYGRHVHDVSSDFVEFAGAAVAEGTPLLGDMAVNEFVLDLKFDAPLAGKWRWFLLGGGGVYIWELDLSADTPQETAITLPGADGTDFGLNAGAGVEYMIHPEAGFGIEADYTYVFGDFDDGYFSFFLTGFFRFGKSAP